MTNADVAARWAEDEAAGLEARASALDDVLLRAAGASDKRLQAQLDQISTHAEVDEELARLRGRLASRPAAGTEPFPMLPICGSKRGRRHGKSASRKPRVAW